MYLELKDRHIYENANVNFALDFFSPHNIKPLAKLLSKHLIRKVSYSSKYNLFNKAMENKTKIYPNFIGGYRMHRLETGFIPYNEAVNVLMRSLSFIEGNGFTTEKCRMKLFINLNRKKLGINEAQMLNKIKFSLRINESKYFDTWYNDTFERPRRNFMSYVYPKGIFNKTINESDIFDIPHNEFDYPDSQYFGIDYKNLSKGFIGLGYPGGKNYHLRKDDILEMMNNGIQIYYNVLNEGAKYNDEDIIKFKEVFNKQKILIDSIKTYESFLARHKNIKLTYDLDENKQKIKFKYPDFRDVLFELLAYGDVVRGEINFDSTRNKMQVNNTVVRNGIGIKNLEFFESKLSGDFYNCMFYNCKLKRSRMFDSKFTNENIITNGVVKNCEYTDNMTRMNNTYVDNAPEYIIDGIIENCIIRNGTINFNASLDKDTVLIRTE